MEYTAQELFESDRTSNQFTVRLLLHHFLNETDLEWLKLFSAFDLSDSQKQALIFVREVGAIDNHTYRQMADCDTLSASNELRILKNHDFLKPKGKGKATYYVAGGVLKTKAGALSPKAGALSTEASALSTEASALSTLPPNLSTPLPNLSTPPPLTFPEELLNEIAGLKQREHDFEKIKRIIHKICSIKQMKSHEIAAILGKREDYIKRKFLSSMIENKELKYLYPEMINHPNQAYLSERKSQPAG